MSDERRSVEMNPEMRSLEQRHTRWMEENRQRREEMRQKHAKQMEELKREIEEDRQKRMEEIERKYAKLMEENRRAHAQRMEEMRQAHAKRMEIQKQGRAKRMEEREQNEVRIARQENSFTKSFDYEDISALVKIGKILMLPMSIGSFIVKASLFPRNSVDNKLFDFLDFFSFFGE